MVKGCQVDIVNFIWKVKDFTQVRDRELDGSSDKVRASNRINTFGVPQKLSFWRKRD